MSDSGLDVEELEKIIWTALPGVDLSSDEMEVLKEESRAELEELRKIFPIARWPGTKYELKLVRDVYARMKAEKAGAPKTVRLECPVCGNVEEIEGLTEEEA